MLAVELAVLHLLQKYIAIYIVKKTTTQDVAREVGGHVQNLLYMGELAGKSCSRP